MDCIVFLFIFVAILILFPIIYDFILSLNAYSSYNFQCFIIKSSAKYN